MFTGIVTQMGEVTQISPIEDGKEVVIHAPEATPDLKLGDSISVNGVCTTVVKKKKKEFTIQLLKETLDRTTFKRLKEGDSTNLELCLTPESRLGGHYVTGHIDEEARIVKLKQGKNFGELTIAFGPSFGKYLIPKGSIAVDGMSLTVAALSDTQFTCHLIPYTLKETTLALKDSGGYVNLEYDMLGKYFYRFYSLGKNNDQKNK